MTADSTDQIIDTTDSSNDTIDTITDLVDTTDITSASCEQNQFLSSIPALS